MEDSHDGTGADRPNKICRNCLLGTEGGNDFITPCDCNGERKYVHRHCLDEWRIMSPNATSFHSCDECGIKYSIEKKKEREFDGLFVLLGLVFDLILLIIVFGFFFLIGGLISFFIDFGSNYTISNYLKMSKLGFYAICGLLFCLLIFLIVSVFFFFILLFFIIRARIIKKPIDEIIVKSNTFKYRNLKNHNFLENKNEYFSIYHGSSTFQDFCKAIPFLFYCCFVSQKYGYKHNYKNNCFAWLTHYFDMGFAPWWCSRIIRGQDPLIIFKGCCKSSGWGTGPDFGDATIFFLIVLLILVVITIFFSPILIGGCFFCIIYISFITRRIQLLNNQSNCRRDYVVDKSTISN